MSRRPNLGKMGHGMPALGAGTPDFKAAGGHLNPRGRQPGLTTPAGSPAGALPQLTMLPRAPSSSALLLPDQG